MRALPEKILPEKIPSAKILSAKILSAKMLAGLMAGGVLLAACGGDDGTGAAGPAPADADSGDTLVVTGLDALDFDADAYTASAGTIDVEYRLVGVIEHSLVVEGREDDMRLVVSAGGTDTGSIDLDAGEYVLYCDIAGHRDAGMVATLTVS